MRYNGKNSVTIYEMKNIIYCRKSTDSEDRQVLSIPAQIEELSQLAKRDNLKIDKVFTESMSAKSPGRPEFQAMIKYIEKNPGTTLIVWKLDRLARNPKDGADIQWLLQQKILKEIKTYEKCYLPTDNVLLMYVELGMANQFLLDLSTNVKRGNRAKLEKGGWTGVAPFGYLNNKADKTVYPDPEKSFLVVKAFELLGGGIYSLKEIAEILYKQGLRSKSGNKIHKSLLYRTITNPFYTGVIRVQGKLYQGSHKPLVSRALFEKCALVLKGGRSRKQKHLFPLTGKIKCAECGCAYTASLAKGHQYYHCSNGKRFHISKRDHIRSEIINQQIAELFKQIQFDEEIVEIMYQAAKEKSQSEKQFELKALEEIQNNQNLLQEKQERLLAVYLNGDLPEEVYKVKNLALNNEAVELANQQKQFKQNLELGGNDTIEQTKKAFLTAVYAEKDFLCADDSKKSELVKILLSNLTVRNRNVECFQFNQPFQLMANAPKKGDILLWQGL